MPELPEVETVVCHIRPFLKNKTIDKAVLPKQYKRAIGKQSLQSFNKKVAGQKIINVTRRAKYILLNLESGAISIHLRMTGRILFNEPSREQKKYVTFTLNLSNGEKMYFKDVRKFGRIEYLNDVSELDKKLGVEPMSAKFTYQQLMNIFKGRSRGAKSLLLDQSYIAGLGNIYVDEVLWKAKIHPLEKSNQVRDKQLKALHRAIPSTLKKSIELNGTTFQSFYFGEETSGEFINKLAVFGREGKKCRRCRNEITKIRVSQRGTHLCTECQPLTTARA